MKLNVFAFFLCMLAFAAARISASDSSNGDDFSVSVLGKVTAVDSTSVTVLGLKILIPTTVGVTSNGNFGGGGNGGGGEGNDNSGSSGGNSGGKGGDGEDGKGSSGNSNGGNGTSGNGDGGKGGGDRSHHGGGSGNGGGGTGGGTSSAKIVVGNFIKAELTSDATPLVAGAVQDWGGYDEGYRLKAPIQAVTSNGNVVTVTVLGLVVNVSKATFDGNNDDDSQSKPLTLADLAVGQNVEIRLDESKLPALFATHLNIRKGTNEVELDCGDHNGDLSSDLTIDATQTVVGTSTVTGKKTKKKVTLHTVTRSTKLVLRGLFPGKAKISYTYQHRKHTANVVVQPNGLTNLKLKFVK